MLRKRAKVSEMSGAKGLSREGVKQAKCAAAREVTWKECAERTDWLSGLTC